MKRTAPVLMMAVLLFPAGVCAEKVIFVYEVYPPYEFHEDGQLVGTDVDIIREVCRRIDIEPVFRELPWERAIKEVTDGKAHAIFSLLKTKEREQFLFFPRENISYEQFIFVVRKGSPVRAKRLDDLKGRRIGQCRGYSYDPAFDTYKGFDREYSSNDEEQLRKLKGGRMDAAIMNREVFRFTARKMGIQDLFEILEFEFAPKHFMYVGFSRAQGKNGRILSEQFDKVLNGMKKQGTFQKIVEKYH